MSAPSRREQVGRAGTWWSERFLGALGPLLAARQLQRGRSTARKGEVTQLDIGPGAVVARVQRAGEEPYEVRLLLPVIDEESWERILDDLAARSLYAARMLAGDLPPEIEEVFAAQGESLLPGPLSRLTTACTCPEWENPCTHAAAVCCLLAEAIDAEPFSVLWWRGMAKDAVLAALGERRGALHDDGGDRGDDAASGSSAGNESLERFWMAGDVESIHACPAAPEQPAAVLRGAPRGVLAVFGVDLCDVLVPLYEAISLRTLERGGLSPHDAETSVPAQGRPAPTSPKV